jgi:hypothetical protein
MLYSCLLLEYVWLQNKKFITDIFEKKTPALKSEGKSNREVAWVEQTHDFPRDETLETGRTI